MAMGRMVKKTTVFLISAILIIMTLFPVTSQAALVWNPLNLSASSTSYSIAPAIASDSGGKIYMAWQDDLSGNYEIYFRKLDGTIQAWTPPLGTPAINISNTSAGDYPNLGISTDPDIAVDSYGNIHVVWTDFLDGNYDVYYRKYDPVSNTWSPSLDNAPRNISNHPNYYTSLEPAICTDSNGIHVVWSANESIYYASSSDGTSWSSPANITNNSYYSYSPDITKGASGALHVVYKYDKQINPTTWNTEIYYRKYNGSSWSSATNLSNSSTTASGCPKIASDTSGVYCVWEEGTSIYYRNSTDGTSWGSPQSVATNSYSPEIAAGPSGTAHVAYTSGANIYYRKCISGTWQTAETIVTNSGQSDYPVISVDSNNYFHILWQDATPTQNASYWDILFTTNMPDNTSPTVPGTPIDDGQYTNSTTQLHFSFSPSTDQETGVSKYLVCIGTTPGGTDIKNDYDVGVDTSPTISGLSLTPGVTYYAKVKAVNGNEIASAYSGNSDGITIHTEIPTVEITNPADGSTVTGTVNIEATASDSIGVTQVKLYIDGSLKATYTGPPYDYSWNTTGLASGSHTIKVEAYDAAGNVGSDTHTVYIPVDNQAPTVEITSPLDNASVKGTVNVQATATDNVGVTKVEFYIDGNLKNTDTSLPFSWSWNTALESDGSHAVKVIAYDAAGNNTPHTHNVTVDNTAPTAEISVPADGSYVTGTVTVQATATDTVGVTKVEFWIDGYWKYTDFFAPYEYSWNTSGLANGSSHTVMVKAFDLALNSTPHTHTVTVDNTAPTTPTSLVANPADWTNTNSFDVSWTNPADNSGIVAAYYKLDSAPSSNTDGTRVAGSNISSISNITVSGSGSHAIYVWLEDGVGNINYVNRAQTTLKYDTTLPTVEITNPADNTTISGTVIVEATATDISGITKVDFYVDGVYKDTDNTSPYTYSWNTTLVSDGPHTITAKAFDGAGNDASHTHNVTIDNTAPTVSSTDPTNGATDVSVGTNIKATFSEDMDPATINTSNFTLKDAQDNPVSGVVSYDPATKIATFNPDGNLAYEETYTATLTTGIKDVAGNSLITNYSWSFTTGIQPTKPVADPGGPYKINEGKLLTLDGSASYDPEGDPLTFDWDFGDGTAHGSGEFPTHTYEVDGTYRTYTVTLIVNDATSYSDPATTTVEVYVRGDVNLDGRVDIFDLVIVSKAFGSTPLDPNWDTAADINGDDQVNIFDLVLVAKDFNKTKL